MKEVRLKILQSRARNFPCKNTGKVGKLRAPWKIMSTLLNYTNFGITLEIQKIMATFLDNIVVKTSFILMPTFSTTAQYRTRVTVETFDTMLVIFHRKNLKKVGKLRASWKIMSMKITSAGLYI